MATPSPLDRLPIDPRVRSFFHAIKENPDDDTPRLIFADWLQEHGNAADAARGEFLRLSVLRHRLSPDDPSYDLFKRREGELFTEYCWTWLGPLMDAAKSWKLERGMVQIAMQAENLMNAELRVWSQTPAALWVDSLTLSELAERHSVDLAYSSLLMNVNCLDLSANGNEPGLGLLFRAFRFQRLPFLMQLKLARCRLTRGPIERLALSFVLRHLKILDLQYNRLDDVAAGLLATSPHLKNVTELRLGHNRFTAEGMVLLRQAFGDRVHF